jgi:5'-nucleotidase
MPSPPTLLLYPSGIFFNPFEPDPAKIHVGDIAHALAAIPRFGGHTAQPYSVAQHSVLVSRVIWERGNVCRRVEALWGLLHEVAEALSGFGDVCGPVKRVPHVAAVVKPIERLIEAAAAVRWGFPPEFASCPVVKAADRYVLDWEDRDLRWEDAPPHLGVVPRTWRPEDLGPPVAGADVVLPKEKIKPLPFGQARRLFLARFAALAPGETA